MDERQIIIADCAVGNKQSSILSLKIVLKYKYFFLFILSKKIKF